MQSTIEALRNITGSDYIIENPSADHPLLVDERQLFRGLAAAIVFPKSVKQLSESVRVCSDAGIAMVPQGGNTGYCGGATPDRSGRQVLVNLQRLNSVREVDGRSATITLEAGVILSHAQEIAKQHKLLLPLSMGSEGSCQIGGNLSTNAGGLAVLRYGTAREMVAGLEVVLPDGRIWSDLKGLRKDNTGYDLKQLFLGAEGTLGIISAAVLRLHPRPTVTATAWLAISNIDDAVSVLAQLRENLGDCLTSFEYISRQSLDLVNQHIDGLRDPLHPHDGNVALVELAAYDASEFLSDRLEVVLERALREGTIRDCAIAQSDAQRLSFWHIRESIPEAEKRAGGAIKHDVSVAIAALGEFVRDAQRMLQDEFPECCVSLFGHVGDGNVHFNVLARSADTAATFRHDCATRISSCIHQLACDRQGSFSAEHGVGQLKRDLLAQTADPLSLELMGKIKRTLDPCGLMNPGKVI